MDKLDSTFRSVRGVRTPATGLMGYLAMLSQGDFEQEKIPKIVDDLVEEIPRIQSKVMEMRGSVDKNTRSNIATLVNEKGLELTHDLSKLETLLKADKQKPKTYKWIEELTFSQKVIRNIAIIYDEFKKMGYVKANESTEDSKKEDADKLKSFRLGKEKFVSPAEVEKANEEAEYKSFVPKELKRAHIEKYKSKTTIGGAILPVLLMILLVGVFLLDWWIEKNINVTLLITTLIFEGILVAPITFAEEWGKQYRWKARLESESGSYKMNEYEDNYYYTDSWWKIFAFRFGKLFYWIINLGAVITIAVLLFQWLGSVSIAPTSIIIILLVIIIYNQLKSKNQ